MRRWRPDLVPRHDHDRARRGRQAHDGDEHRRRPRKDMSGAVDEVARRAGSDQVGVTGFCMGGGLALGLPPPAAGQDPAAAGRGTGKSGGPGAQPDGSERRRTTVLGHYAELDGFFGPTRSAALTGRTLERRWGRTAERIVHPGVGPRLLQRHPPRGLRRRHVVPRAWARRSRSSAHHLGKSAGPAGATRRGRRWRRGWRGRGGPPPRGGSRSCGRRR